MAVVGDSLNLCTILSVPLRKRITLQLIPISYALLEQTLATIPRTYARSALALMLGFLTEAR